MKIKIIFPKQFFTSKQLQKFTGHEVEFIEGNTIDLEKISSLFSKEEYILVVNPTYLKDNWSAFPIERIQRMKGLKALCLTTSSYSWIDTKKCADLGIIVTNIPGAPTEAVAEFNIYMMLSLLRKLPLIVKNEWKMDYEHFLNEEFKELSIGIIGFGRIGMQVAKLCKGLGLNVRYWNRNKKETKHEENEADSPKSGIVFKKVIVNTGISDEKYVEIFPIDEISENEDVVSKGTFYLKSELKKSELSGHED